MDRTLKGIGGYFIWETLITYYLSFSLVLVGLNLYSSSSAIHFVNRVLHIENFIFKRSGIGRLFCEILCTLVMRQIFEALKM